MSARRRKGQDDRLFSLVSKGGRITFPPDFLDLKLGQRVYFDVGERGVPAHTPQALTPWQAVVRQGTTRDQKPCEIRAAGQQGWGALAQVSLLATSQHAGVDCSH